MFSKTDESVDPSAIVPANSEAFMTNRAYDSTPNTAARARSIRMSKSMHGVCARAPPSPASAAVQSSRAIGTARTKRNRADVERNLQP